VKNIWITIAMVLAPTLVTCGRGEFEIEQLTYDRLTLLKEDSALMKVENILRNANGIVCLIRPYTQQIPSQIWSDNNDHLRRFFPLSEGEFLFVWMTTNITKVNYYSRGAELDVARFEEQITIGGYSYRSVQCASVSSAFVRLSESERGMLIDLIEKQ
jgi:hypothetical protein